jgi:outer membrane protein assembly factor BamB
MARTKHEPLIIGIGSHVVSLDPRTGTELWRTQLKSSSYVTVSRAGAHIHAGAGGELWCLNAQTGEIVWHNKLRGLGRGIIAFASSVESVMAAAITAQQTAAVVAATI